MLYAQHKCLKIHILNGLPEFCYTANHIFFRVHNSYSLDFTLSLIIYTISIIVMLMLFTCAKLDFVFLFYNCL